MKIIIEELGMSVILLVSGSLFIRMFVGVLSLVSLY